MTTTGYEPTFETDPNGFNYRYDFTNSKWEKWEEPNAPVSAKWSSDTNTDSANELIHTAIAQAKALYPEATCVNIIAAYYNNTDGSMKIAMIFTENLWIPEDWPEPIWYTP